MEIKIILSDEEVDSIKEYLRQTLKSRYVDADDIERYISHIVTDRLQQDGVLSYTEKKKEPDNYPTLF
jgi:hypothetical protein